MVEGLRDLCDGDDRDVCARGQRHRSPLKRTRRRQTAVLRVQEHFHKVRVARTRARAESVEFVLATFLLFENGQWSCRCFLS